MDCRRLRHPARQTVEFLDGLRLWRISEVRFVEIPEGCFKTFICVFEMNHRIRLVRQRTSLKLNGFKSFFDGRWRRLRGGGRFAAIGLRGSSVFIWTHLPSNLPVFATPTAIVLLTPCQIYILQHHC
jgi:hypothetical protein